MNYILCQAPDWPDVSSSPKVPLTLTLSRTKTQLSIPLLLPVDGVEKWKFLRLLILIVVIQLGFPRQRWALLGGPGLLVRPSVESYAATAECRYQVPDRSYGIVSNAFLLLSNFGFVMQRQQCLPSLEDPRVPLPPREPNEHLIPWSGDRLRPRNGARPCSVRSRDT